MNDLPGRSCQGLTDDSCAIEMSMVVSHLVWLFRTRGIRQRAKEAGKTFDEFNEGIEWQAKGIDVEKRLRYMFKRRVVEGSPGAVADDVEALPTLKAIVPKTVPNPTE